MVLVLVFIAVVGISLYSMIEYSLNQKRQSVKTANILDLKFALDSTVDFVLFGIKQKYCFSDTLMNDSNCNIQHDGSTERLIMSPEQVNFMVLAQKITPAQAPALRLQKITRDLEIANVSSTHPLFTVLRSLQMQKEMNDIRFIHVEIERVDSAYLPRSGNEIYVNITVSLVKTAGDLTTITVDNKKLQVVSHLVLYPREVGSFALLAPRDIYLGSSGTGSSGDLHFYGVGSKAQFNGRQGLVFLSPVFVNRNIVLNQASYSPVTFSDRVYMGEGKVLSGNRPYEPASNGGPTGRYWRDVASFGGFLRGLENDGAQDAGLNSFVGNATTAPGNDALMARCIERNLSQSDLRKILNSDLVVQTKNSDSSTFAYLLKLTNSEFEGQSVNNSPRLQNWGRSSLDVEFPGNFKKIIMDVTLKVGARSATFGLSKSSQAVAMIEVGSPQYENSLKSDAENAKKEVQRVLNDPLATSSEIQNARAAELSTRDKLDQYRTAAANPPKITITTDPIQRLRGTSNSKVNFKVTVNNPGNLLDGNGNLVNPEILIKAYDSGYMDGGFIGFRKDTWLYGGKSFPENLNLRRTLGFTINANSATVTAPGGLPTATTQDYEDLGDLCMNARDSVESQAFGMADANVRFTSSTRTSWNFAGTGSETSLTKKDPLISSLQFDGTNAVAGAKNTTFQVRSIVGTCTIKGSANFVTGFFACDKLVIEARQTPLRIIGTFIAGNIDIHPSAYAAGIVWSSIYHPQSVVELRKEGILKRTSNNGPCTNTPSSPIWNPFPSIQEVADRLSCNVISLRAKADPFQWTAVDPDCGLLPGQSNMTCKKRLVRFFVVEQDREEAR